MSTNIHQSASIIDGTPNSISSLPQFLQWTHHKLVWLGKSVPLGVPSLNVVIVVLVVVLVVVVIIIIIQGRYL